MTPSLRLINLLEPHAELREILTFTTLLKDMIKDTDEQPDEEMDGARYVGRAQNFRVLSRRRITLPAPPGVHQPGSSPNPLILGFLWRLPYIGMIDYVIGDQFNLQLISGGLVLQRLEAGFQFLARE